MKRIPYAGAEPARIPWKPEELCLMASMRKSGSSNNEIADAIMDRFLRPSNEHDIASALSKYRRREAAA